MSQYVSSTAVALVLDYLQQRGIQRPDLRARLIAMCDSPNIPAPTWYALLNDVAEADGRSDTGLRMAAMVQPQHIGSLGYLVIHSDSLIQALQRFCRFQALLHNVIASDVHLDGEHVVVRWQRHPQPLPPLVSDQIVVGGMITLIRNHTTLSEAHPVQVSFPQDRPDDLAPCIEFFRCPVQFNAPSLSITLPITLLTNPIKAPDADLAALLEQHAQRMLDDLASKDDLLVQLRNQIARCLQDGEPEFQLVANRMGMAERTLYRHLQDRGVRFKVVLNQLRFSMAKDYLKDPRLSMTEIALLLGYTEQSVFTRSFKAWSGMTPLQYRQQLAHTPQGR